MSSSSKKRQTMAKITRERMVKERRALKQEKKQEKKEAARSADAPAAESSEHLVDGEASGD
jgi:hypothetical protein